MNSRFFRIISFCFLFIGLLSLGIGVSYYSSSIAVSSLVQAIPKSNLLRVVLSSSDIKDGTVITGDVIPSRNVEGFQANPAVIDNTGEPKLKDIFVTFTEPGQAVSYSFYVANIGEYISYLKSITFENVDSSNTYKECVAGDNTTTSLVMDACQDIIITIDVGSLGVQTGSVSNISNHSLLSNHTEKVVLNIEYPLNGHRTDGDFKVTFGDISFLYTSNDF